MQVFERFTLGLPVFDGSTSAYPLEDRLKYREKDGNRDASARNLAAAGIAFETRNGGAHLIVSHAGQIADFWPGTGLWVVRGTSERSYGVRSLIKQLGDCRAMQRKASCAT